MTFRKVPSNKKQSSIQKRKSRKSSKAFAKSKKIKKQDKILPFKGRLLVLLKKLSPLGIFVFISPFYISYYPSSLKIDEELINEYRPLTHPIIFTNTNPYKIKNVHVEVYASYEEIRGSRNSVAKNGSTHNSTKYKEIGAGRSGSVHNQISTIEWDIKITSIKGGVITVVSSYDTPWFYPSIKNDTAQYIPVVNSSGELKYLPN